MINELDIDGSGTIDFPEYLSLMSRKMKDTTVEEELIEACKVFDIDGSGLITADKLRHVLTTGERLTDKEIEEFNSGDYIDVDGNINYEEYIKMVIL